MSANKASALLKLLVVLLFLGAAGAAVWFYVRPVAKVVTVGRGTAANVVQGSVVVDAERVSPIASEVEGKVTETILAPGKEVKEGEILVQLDPADINLEIAQAKNEFEAAQENAKIALEVNRLQWTSQEEALAAAELDYKQGRSSPLAIEKSRRDFEVAKQTRAKAEADDKLHVATRENTLKVAERKKEKMTIRAPFDGTITEVWGGRKNDVVAAKQPIANIIGQTRLVRAMISEEHFAAIKVEDKAKVNFLGYAGKVFDATVAQKLPTAEAGTQRYTIHLTVDPPPEQLLPNLTGDVGITIGEHPNVLLVPRRAMWDGYVYVVENGRAREQKLDMGYVDFNMIEVKGGLKEGDLVIIEQLDKFRDGQRVRIELAR